MKLKTLLIALAWIPICVSGSGDAMDARSNEEPEYRIGVSLPSYAAAIAAVQAGTIVEILVKDGEAVTSGQVLFRLGSTLENLEVERLKALVDSDVSVERARAALAYAKRTETRTKRLSNDGITSEADLDDRELEVQIAELKLKQAKLDKVMARNELKQAEARLDHRTLRSPVSGLVTQILKRHGEATEKLVPVLELMKLDPLWIEFECPVKDAAKFRRGTSVVVSPEARRSDRRTGKVEYLSMNANASSGTFRVRVSVVNTERVWKAGLKMWIEVPSKSSGEVARPKPSGK